MEQLAHFVTKSFEYNNNRVLDVINMATRSLICDNFKSSDSLEAISNGEETDIEDDADSVDIDITDMSSDEAPNEPHEKESQEIVCKDSATISHKKSNKENLGQKTKNWLIGDHLKRDFGASVKNKRRRRKSSVKMKYSFVFFLVSDRSRDAETDVALNLIRVNDSSKRSHENPMRNRLVKELVDDLNRSKRQTKETRKNHSEKSHSTIKANRENGETGEQVILFVKRPFRMCIALTLYKRIRKITPNSILLIIDCALFSSTIQPIATFCRPSFSFDSGSSAVFIGCKIKFYR